MNVLFDVTKERSAPSPRREWDLARPRLRGIILALALVVATIAGANAGDMDGARRTFDEQIRPILEDYCYSCHGYGIKKGGLSLDGPGQGRPADAERWWAVFRNVRAGLMPPAGAPRLSEFDQQVLEGWIKTRAFGLDPENPDPGHLTLRRLNRVEYRNTVRDLMGVDYETNTEFPPDDTGHGFDNMADVLTVSPLLMEKYLAAAKSIVAQAVPTAPWVIEEAKLDGRSFQSAGGSVEGAEQGPRSLSYYEPASVTKPFIAKHPGRYQLVLDFSAGETEAFGPDFNKCRVLLRGDGRELFRRDLGREEDMPFRYRFNVDWGEGEHELTLALRPLTPNEKRRRGLEVRFDSLTVRGPLQEQFWVRPANYERFFPGNVPEGASERRLHARSLLRDFTLKAFRRPPDEDTLDRLVAFAEREYSRPRSTFEAGLAQAMAAVLASPRFLFRLEGFEEGSSETYPLIDEYALASRLSYFLWSSMPDEELFRLAERHELRKNLHAQVRRMLDDPRSEEFVRNFVGQWLQARDLETVQIHAFDVIRRDRPRTADAERAGARWRELGRRDPQTLSDDEKTEWRRVRAAYFQSFRTFRESELTEALRLAMRRETEMLFGLVVRENRDIRELLDADYAFLNERLARHYRIDGVEGDEMRLVALPPGSPRGGILTQGTVLAVTSNPNRTSPVKRGLFILENILGMPPPPPPPNIPPLENANHHPGGRPATLREALRRHRENPSCRSCHDRMDPLGLALENFNALGQWRDRERDQPIDASGTLLSGESFSDVRKLKRILAEGHRREFYRCLSEKMFVYAIGRGLTYQDVATMDTILERLEREDGRAGALILGIVESAPFQRCRRPSEESPRDPSTQATAHVRPSLEPRTQP